MKKSTIKNLRKAFDIILRCDENIEILDSHWNSYGDFLVINRNPIRIFIHIRTVGDHKVEFYLDIPKLQPRIICIDDEKGPWEKFMETESKKILEECKLKEIEYNKIIIEENKSEKKSRQKLIQKAREMFVELINKSTREEGTES